MESTRRSFLSVLAGATALAGCSEAGITGPTPTDQDATPSPTGQADPAVQVYDHAEYGEILVGPEQLTLYMFDQDTEGEAASACYDDCADAWPPLTVSEPPTAGDGVTASLNTFERETGGMQVMAGGWPLYYFGSDEAPGDVTGQGINEVWWILTPSGTPIRPDASAGY